MARVRVPQRLFVVAVLLAACVLSAAMTAPCLAGGTTVSVSATTPWSVDTGVSLTVGQEFKVMAKGMWTSGAWTGGPNGQPSQPPTSGAFLLPGSIPYALIGKIGASGAPFFIGSKYSGIAGFSGNLFLSMNDVPGVFWDNSGALSVTVKVSGKKWLLLYSSKRDGFGDWEASDSGKFYFDPAAGAYHYAITDAGQDYAFVRVPYSGGSFRLQFDWLPVSTDPNSNHAFGMWGPEMSTVAYSGVYMNGRSLTGANETGLFLDIVAFDDAATWPWPVLTEDSIRGLFENGVWYDVTLTYDKAAATVNLYGERESDDQFISDETLVGNGRPFGEFTLDRLAFSSLGDFGYPGMTAAGYVRNVKLFEQMGKCSH